MTDVVAAAGVFLLAALAPFETTTPIVQLPGQALTNLEAALMAAVVVWGGALALSHRWPRVPPLWRAWLALIAVMAVASSTAPSHRLNAFHMTGRLTAAAVVMLLAANGITSPVRLRTALRLCVAAGVVVAGAAMLEYMQVPSVLRALEAFRPSIAVVGAQLRASGTLQYPTIASMYLEVVFAFGLGLMLWAIDRSHPIRAGMLFVALLVIGEAIALTFTRAGLVTVAASLVLSSMVRLQQRGVDAGIGWVGALTVGMVILVGASHSSQSLWLRMTSEGQRAWYRAAVNAPPNLSMSTDRMQPVGVAVTNVGHAIWDSDADPPILLSYHWLDAAGHRVVAFEGERTAFDQPVLPGETVTVDALVRAPGRPGEYRLEWDLVQEGRLWFSTEEEAPESSVSCATVTGPGVGVPLRTTDRPRRAVRPGRLVLWRAAVRMIAAHPIFGVGPDNFRLLYGSYAGLPHADSRTHTNNMYLEMVVGGGLAAAAAFIWLLRESSRVFGVVLMRADPVRVSLAAAGAAIALHGLVDSFVGFGPTYVLFGLTLGCAAGAGRLESSRNADRL